MSEEITKLLDEQKSMFKGFKEDNEKRLKAIEDGNGTAEFEVKLAKYEKDFATIETKLQDYAKVQEAKADQYADMEKKIDEMQLSIARGGAYENKSLTRDEFEFKGLWTEYKKGNPSDKSWEDKADAFWDVLGQSPNATMTPELMEKKTLTIADGTTGGYFAPPQIVNEILKGVREVTPVMQIAKIKTTGRKSIVFPKKTGTITATRGSEVGTVSENTGLSFGGEEITLPEMDALIKVSYQDLEDSMFNLHGEIKEEIIEAFDAKLGTEFISGVGADQLEGININAAIAASSSVSGDADELTADGIIQFMTANLLPKYDKSAKVLFNQTTLSVIRVMKSSNNYLWTPGFGATPNTINGKSYIICPDCPDISAGAFPMFYGDFKKGYCVGLRLRISIQKLVELYAINKTVGFLARSRVGGQVILAEAIKKLEVSA